MADEEKEGETSSRGADWEVVSLTASTYAAAPGPEGFDPADESKGGEFNRNERESSSALIMSGHFVFPPNEHENLPIEPGFPEIHSETEGQDVDPAGDESDGPNKTLEENIASKPDDDPHGIQFFDNGSNLSVHGMELREPKGLQRLSLVGEEHLMYVDPEFSAFHAETDRSGSVPCTESEDFDEADDPTHQNVQSPLKYGKTNEEDKFDGSGLPCEAWWKRHAASVYRHAKEANTLWSVVVAATLMGLVILGQRWQREKWQLHQLKWRFGTNDERMGRMLGPISRFKDLLIGGGHQRSPVISAGASANL